MLKKHQAILVACKRSSDLEMAEEVKQFIEDRFEYYEQYATLTTAQAEYVHSLGELQDALLDLTVPELTHAWRR